MDKTIDNVDPKKLGQWIIEQLREGSTLYITLQDNQVGLDDPGCGCCSTDLFEPIENIFL